MVVKKTYCGILLAIFSPLLGHSQADRRAELLQGAETYIRYRVVDDEGHPVPAADVKVWWETDYPRLIVKEEGARTDDVFLALAKHIPAVSSPVGEAEVVTDGISENHDLNELVYRNGWGRNHIIFGTSWLHSDMKDMSYWYVYKLYTELVMEKGAMK